MAIDKQRGELLFEAISESDFSKVVDEINKGLNINEKLFDEETLLHKSYLFKNIQIAEHLILSGAKLFETNKTMRTPLHIGAANGFYEGCELYTLLAKDLNQQDHKGRIPLMHALKFRQKTIIKLLMGNGSDTNLEDSNGYSALMWAIKFLNPEELKEIFTSDDEEALEEQLENYIEDGKDVQVADTSIAQFEDIYSDSMENDSHEHVMPNPLKEMLGKKKDRGDDIIPYSISDHIESLKQKAREQSAYDYNINESIEKGSNEEGDPSLYDIEKQESTTDKSIESFSRQVNKDEIEKDNTSKADEAESIEEVTNIKDNGISDQDEDSDIMRMSSSGEEKESDDDIIRVKGGESAQKTEQEKVSRPKSSELELIEEDAAPEDHGNSSEKNEQTRKEEAIRVTSNEDMEKQKNESIIIRSKEDAQQENNEIQKIKTQNTEEEIINYENEIQKIKKLDDPNIDDDLYASSDKNKEELVEDKDSQVDITEEMSNTAAQKDQGASIILEKKKDITYLRDGIKEVYKDEYGEIKNVDKNISQEELSEIKERDKSITNEELSKIKVVDKNVRPQQEVQYIEREEGNENKDIEKTNLEGKISYENVDGYSEKVKEKSQKESDQLARPKSGDIETYQEEVFDGEIKKKSDSKKAESDVMGIARGTGEIDNDGKGEFKFKEIENTEEEEEEEEVTNSLDEIKDTITSEDQAHNIDDMQENRETIQEEENDPDLSPAENKLLQAMSDPDHKNKKGQSLCWLAAFNGQVGLLKKLIHKGANYEIKDPQGVSPLMAASMKGQEEVVDYLVHKVRSVDEKRSDGHTALSLAIQYDQDEIVKILSNNGANVEHKLKGNTLLMHAAENNATKCINTLIMLGADPLEKNMRGKTALDIAKIKKKKQAYVLIAKIMKARLRKSVEDASIEDEE